MHHSIGPTPMPFRQCDLDVLGAAQQDQLPIVEVHHLAAQGDPSRGELRELSIQIVDDEPNLIEPELVEAANVRIPWRPSRSSAFRGRLAESGQSTVGPNRRRRGKKRRSDSWRAAGLT
jgi:hypothetical protein